MPDPTLIVALTLAALTLGWTALALAQAQERRTNTRRLIGRQRRDRAVRELKHRARRWYRWQGRLQLIGAERASHLCGDRGGRIWRDAKDLEREPDTAYALRALPFTTRR